MILEDMQDIAKDISFEYLKNNPIATKIESGIKTFAKVQETLLNLYDSNNEKDLMQIKIGTVITWEVVNRIANGKTPNNFSTEDWADIANKIANDAINLDAQQYTKRVFFTYADYIDVSATVIENNTFGNIPKEKVDQIKLLAKEIYNKSYDLDAGKISESNYVEECLWISFEAMIKLLTISIGKYACPEVRDLIDGISSYGFEYGRLVLYKKEQALLDEILEHQGQIDIELQTKYEAYINELNDKVLIFNNLINNAFDTDIRNQLKGSIALAQASGVDESEILYSIENIDDFFVN